MVLFSTSVYAGFFDRIDPSVIGRNLAVKEVNDSARRIGADISVFNAQWLQSPQEFRDKNKDAQTVNDGANDNSVNLVRKTQAFGYDATILYVFKNDLLLQVVVILFADPTENRFMSIQNQMNQINKQFAQMPPPISDNVSVLHSKLDVADSVMTFRLDHRIMANTPVGPREQFIVYKK
ncbi:hypothetical protein [uncultured Lamprocystis sp.]|jgi:hypothetical protein|uniref:hypothetical protein n=1 Tax=uncultured Lamprocystis sp. TaxID=543132 RepID=UPI0025E89685|nr:hypothetical protein [uncultured Lamprocystis sp.]